MPRISQRFQNILSPTSPGGQRATEAELSNVLQSAPADEVRDFAERAIDTCESTAAITQVANRIGLDALPKQLGRFGDHPATLAWKNGEFELERYASGQAGEAIVLMQRALIKIGSHHPSGGAVASLMQMPYGADGDLGQSTVDALNAAMVMAGRGDLAMHTVGSPVSSEVAMVLDGLLAQTPSINHPALLNVSSPPPAPTTNATAAPSTSASGGGALLGTLFGKASRPITNPMSKWEDVVQRIEAERPRYDGSQGPYAQSAKYWHSELQEMEGKSRMFQVNRVNTLVNDWPYTSDEQLYGQTDKWATPLEFLTRGTGDCEDYAITKYESLRRLGVPESDMRLLAVQDLDAGVAHMVLAVQVDGQVKILDNQYGFAMDPNMIRSESGGYRYAPLYSMNRSGKWLFG